MSNATRKLTGPGTGNERERWSSHGLFVLAAAGSAVGLGNIWKFPYIAGENGGGAFVLVYLAAIVVVGLPILVAEILIGRRGDGNLIDSLRRLSSAERRSNRWQVVGWMGLAGSFLILSFYSVVAGWALVYVQRALTGAFETSGTLASSQHVTQLFTGLLDDPLTLLASHTVFMLLTVIIVSYGVRRGLERVARWLMPSFIVLLLALVGYAAMGTDSFVAGLAFLFQPDFSALSWSSVLIAVGHAFFTLSVGIGAMLTYGSYLPASVSIGRAAVTICILDTLIALLAGVAIFPIVFANGLEAAEGPGLVFTTLPIAFAQMPGGGVISVAFFTLLVLAALTSSPSLLEPIAEFVRERTGLSKAVAARRIGFAIWIFGAAHALSFNEWSGFRILGMSLFDAADYLASNIILPLGGVALALFAGWALSEESTREELSTTGAYAFRIWRTLVRYVAPSIVVVVFLYSLS